MPNQTRTASLKVSDAVRARLANAFATGESLARTRLNTEQTRALEAAGLLTYQISDGKGEVVRVANLSSFANNEGDLRHVLAAYITDPAIPEVAKRAAKTVVRLATDASEQCSMDALLKAASTVGADRLIGLAAEVEAKAKARNVAGQARRNYKSAAKKLARYAAEKCIVPLVWPERDTGDEWTAVIRGAVEKGKQTRSGGLLLYLRPACIELFGAEGRDPRNLTLEQAEAAFRHMRSRGQYREANVARMGLSWLAQKGIGPLAAHREADDLPILSSDEFTVGRSEGLIALLKARGYPKSLVEAVQYHADACLLTSDELALKGGEHPVRRIREQVTATTFVAHSSGIRLLLGVAEKRMGWKPSQTTPEKLLGEVHVIIAHLKQEWVERAAAGYVSAATTNGLSQSIHTFALLAQTLLGRAVHMRARLAKNPRANPKALMALLQSEGIYKDAYDVAAEAAKGVKAKIKNTPRGNEKNTQKDIEQQYAIAPPAYWFRTLRCMLKQVEKDRRANRTDQDSLLREMMTFALALLMATGFRWAEVCHLRLDKQFTPELRKERKAKLSANDRKNDIGHTGFYPDNYVPEWLLSDVLLRVRPLLVGEQDHPWLFVTPRGRAIGCEEEDENGEGRDEIAFRGREGRARVLWQEIVAPFAYEANGYCPAEEGEFTPHVIRNVFGAEVVMREGIDRAAHYLGDSPRSVRGVYGFLEGKSSKIENLGNEVMAQIAAEL